MSTVVSRPLARPIVANDAQYLVGDLIQPNHPCFGVIWINPERMSGEPCFYASRVPLKNLFDYLEGGYSLNSFLDDFEGVTREQATTVLELARLGLLTQLPHE